MEKPQKVCCLMLSYCYFFLGYFSDDTSVWAYFVMQSITVLLIHNKFICLLFSNLNNIKKNSAETPFNSTVCVLQVFQGLIIDQRH